MRSSVRLQLSAISNNHCKSRKTRARDRNRRQLREGNPDVSSSCASAFNMVYVVLALALVFVGSHTLDAQTPTPSENVTAPGLIPTIEVRDVVVVHGKCIYGGLAMEPTTLNLMKEPCEAWTCDAENYTVTIQRCGDFKVPSHCDLESTLEPFPSCCPVMVCEGI